MNDEPRQKLRELIFEYGRSLCDVPNRCEALLKDYCGIHKREIFVLMSALKKRVTDDLLRSSAGIPQEIVIGRLCKRLEDELAFTSEASHWAVESWALALGYITVASPTDKMAVQSKPPTVTSSEAPIVSPPHIAEVFIAGRYLDNGDGTVTDATTNLQWMRFSLGQEWKRGTCLGEAKRYKWQEAMEAANNLNRSASYARQRDWRLPTKEELLSIVFCSSGLPKIWNDTGKRCEGDYDRATIEQQAFPNTPSSYFWSGSPYADVSGSAWFVDFYDGSAYDSYRYHYHHVRLVRGGQ